MNKAKVKLMEFIDEFGESINGINWAIAAWAETFMPAAQQSTQQIHSILSLEWKNWLNCWLLRREPPKRMNEWTNKEI